MQGDEHTSVMEHPSEPESATDLAAGRFSACVEHRSADEDGPCAHCGWLAADHTVGLATVVGMIGTATPLRRAS